MWYMTYIFVFKLESRNHVVRFWNFSVLKSIRSLVMIGAPHLVKDSTLSNSIFNFIFNFKLEYNIWLKYQKLGDDLVTVFGVILPQLLMEPNVKVNKWYFDFWWKKSQSTLRLDLTHRMSSFLHVFFHSK